MTSGDDDDDDDDDASERIPLVQTCFARQACRARRLLYIVCRTGSVEVVRARKESAANNEEYVSASRKGTTWDRGCAGERREAAGRFE